MISKITVNLEKFNYNVIIANMHETYNFLTKIIDKKINKKVLIENYKKILIIMSPVIPHIINECFEVNKFDINQNWPSINKSQLVEAISNIVVQIGGKKKGVIKAKIDSDEKTIMELISKADKINKYLINKDINKIFFVKNRLINIVLND